MTWIPPHEFLLTVPRALHGTGVVLLDEQGRVLLLHDTPDEQRKAAGWGLYWWPPGGLLDHGESPSEGARRETAEETGLDVEALSFLGSDFRGPTSDWPAVTNYYFTAAPLTPAQVASIRLSAEHDAYQFVHPDECPNLVATTRMRTLAALLAARTANRTCFLEEGETK
jgi:8-oxo-dGTP pyrophosphatase MutT (NUDIX family)